MQHASKRLPRRLFALSAGVFVSACAAGLPEVEPVDIPRLEQEIAAAPEDSGLQVQLGMAQFKAGEHEAARASI